MLSLSSVQVANVLDTLCPTNTHCSLFSPSTGLSTPSTSLHFSDLILLRPQFTLVESFSQPEQYYKCVFDAHPVIPTSPDLSQSLLYSSGLSSTLTSLPLRLRSDTPSTSFYSLQLSIYSTPLLLCYSTTQTSMLATTTDCRRLLYCSDLCADLCSSSPTLCL